MLDLAVQNHLCYLEKFSKLKCKKNFIKIIFGYRNLLKENKLDFISQYQEEISKIKLINDSFINNYFFLKQPTIRTLYL